MPHSRFKEIRTETDIKRKRRSDVEKRQKEAERRKGQMDEMRKRSTKRNPEQ